MIAGKNAPSGIAQLRQSADQQSAGQDRGQAASTTESMNLDDFIMPSSIASPGAPANAPSPPSSDFAHTASTSATTVTPTAASAIPIRKHQQLQDQDFSSGARASAPSVAPAIKVGGHDFDYVQRHVRKTSIDERRVSFDYLIISLHN